MSLLAEGQAWTVIHGDCLEVLPRIATASVDSVVTDPPYELGFMGKTWDASGVAYSVDLWREVLRVLKPGGHLLAFGGTRTYHRMAVAIEDAGFEIRDSLHWMYGTGFPKSLNVSKAIDDAAGATREQGAPNPYAARRKVSLSGNGGTVAIEGGDMGPSPTHFTAPSTDAAKQWDGWGTALKPGHEPIVLARKPLEGTVAANVQRWGTGGLNIDGCRIGDDTSRGDRYNGKAPGGGETVFAGAQERNWDVKPGRWPANVLLDEAAAAELDAQSGHLHGSGNKSDTGVGKDKDYDASSFHVSYAGRANRDYGSPGGGASRFFYVAKPDRAQRDLGCGDLEAATGGEATGREDGSAGVGSPRAGAGRTGGARNIHPTVKPVELMQYLVRLVTPPGGVVLDPFTGSGATGAACRFEDLRFLGIEREPEYVAIARLRIERAHEAAPITRSIERAADIDPRQTSIFDVLGAP